MFLRLIAYGRKILVKPFELTDFALVSSVYLPKEYVTISSCLCKLLVATLKATVDCYVQYILCYYSLNKRWPKFMFFY